MPPIKQVITLIDLGATPNPAYIKRSPAIRSLYCGIISIIIILILILYSINKLSTLGSVIEYENHQNKNNPFINMHGFQFNLSLMYDDNGRFLDITNQNMFKQGFNVSVQHYSPQKVQSMYLISNYDQKNIHYFTIPPNLSKSLHYKTKYDSQYIRIKVQRCSPFDSKDCNYLTDLHNKQLWIVTEYIYNSGHVYDGQVQQSFDYGLDFLYLDRNETFTKDTMLINAYQHTSDLSFLPKSITKANVIKSWCYFDSNFKQSKTQLSQFKVFQIKASQYTYYQSQKMEKIDYILPQIFTLFSLAILILAKISFHYRRWALHLTVAHDIYGNKQQQKQKNSLLTENDNQSNIMGINLKNYFTYLTTKPQNSQLVKQTRRKIKKAEKKIDLLQIAHEVHKLKKKVKIMCKKSKITEQQLERLVVQQPSSESQSQSEEMISETNSQARKKLLQN